MKDLCMVNIRKLYNDFFRHIKSLIQLGVILKDFVYEA